MREDQIKNREFSVDVIIPQYDEKPEVIKPLLDSIDFQIGVDKSKIGVIIVNDHNPAGKLPQEFLNSYPSLNIRYLETPENKGPGQARQFGIDASEAEYLLFADADDRFYSCNVFHNFFEALVQHKDKVVDIVYSKWIEELKQPENNNLYLHVSHNADNTWVFSKLYRREFLTSRNIRFSEELRVHEDAYFCTISQMNAGTTLSIDNYSYFWCYNTASITRNKNNKYVYLVESIDDLVKSIDTAMEELKKRKTPNRNEYIVKGVLFLFFLLNSSFWNTNLDTDEDLKRRRQKFEYSLFKLLAKYKEEFNSFTRAEFLQFYNAERAQSLLNTGFESEYFTWDQFVTYLSNTYPKYSHTCSDCKYRQDGKECEFGGQCTISLDSDYGVYSTPTHWADPSIKDEAVNETPKKSTERKMNKNKNKPDNN